MKMDKLGKSTRDCLYPFDELQVSDGYPSRQDFAVSTPTGGQISGLSSLQTVRHICRVCRFSGVMVPARGPWTRQMMHGVHLHDPWFTGLLAHSCDPNVFLDMSELWMWSLKDIARGDLLYMDLASTEEQLPAQFACQCGSPQCRGWITGYEEAPNAQGQLFLRHWYRQSPC